MPAYDPDFVTLLPDTVIWEPFVGTDKRGQAVYGAATTIPAYANRLPHVVRTKTNVEVIAHTQTMIPAVYLANGLPVTINIQPEDRLTFADGSQPVILNVDYNSDERGIHDYLVST